MVNFTHTVNSTRAVNSTRLNQVSSVQFSASKHNTCSKGNVWSTPQRMGNFRTYGQLHNVWATPQRMVNSTHGLTRLVQFSASKHNTTHAVSTETKDTSNHICEQYWGHNTCSQNRDKAQLNMQVQPGATERHMWDGPLLQSSRVTSLRWRRTRYSCL